MAIFSDEFKRTFFPWFKPQEPAIAPSTHPSLIRAEEVAAQPKKPTHEPLNVEQYHEMYHVTPDVFVLEGDVHPHFEPKSAEHAKNLLIMPQSLHGWLEDNRSRSTGANEALKVMGKYRENNYTQVAEGVVYEFSPSLDVLVTRDNSVNPTNARAVVERVSHLAQRDNFHVVTTRDGLGIHFADFKRVSVERPKFMYGPALLEKSVIDAQPLAELFYAEGTKDFVEPAALEERLEEKLIFNQFYRFKNASNHTQFAWYNAATGKVERIDKNAKTPLKFNKHSFKDGLFGIQPKSMEQYLLMQYLLLNEDIRLVFVSGGAGSGKTVVIESSMLPQVMRWTAEYQNNMLPLDEGTKAQKDFYKERREIGSAYNQAIFYKGGWGVSSVGFLPGTYEEKTKPALYHYEDAFKLTTLHREGLNFWDLTKDHRVPVDPAKPGQKPGFITPHGLVGKPYSIPLNMPFIDNVNWDQLRGRSFARQFMILDESQNEDPQTIKTAMERISEGCKVVIVGDPRQIDNPKYTQYYNGLMCGLRHALGPNLVGRPDVGFFNLSHSYRDPLSAHFAKMQAHRPI